MPESAPPRASPSFALSVGFLALYIALDWASYIRPVQGFNITPWSPQAAIAIALLLWYPRAGWHVAAALALAEIVVRGLPPNGLPAAAGISSLSLAYMAIAHLLRNWLDGHRAIETRGNLWRLVGVAFVGSLVCGTIYVLSLKIAGSGPDGPAYRAIVLYGIGDFVGTLVVLPLVLCLSDRRQRGQMRALLRTPQWWASAGAVVALIAVVFAAPGRPLFNYIYLLLLPVIYLSARFGLSGAVMASNWAQVWLIVAVQQAGPSDLAVFELQALVAAIALTALLQGVTTDEQNRANANLRQTLRFAAAGQMSAALAHELGQPLTAISNYANASKLLLARDLQQPPGGTAAAVPAPDALEGTLDRIVAETHKAAEVVRRLRDFFQSGSMRLQPVDPSIAVEEAVAGLAQRARSLGVRVTVNRPAHAPQLLIDPVQLGVVLRNLLDNAIEAASRSVGTPSVEVSVLPEREQLRLCVADSGPGVGAEQLDQLFEPGPSTRPGGMGIGLSLCRSIIEAHEGRLWLESGSQTRFWISLPLDTGKPDRPDE